MGNQQSFTEPHNNSKFAHFQLSKNQFIKKILLTINIHSQSNDLTPFLILRDHRLPIYSGNNVFSPQFIRTVHDGLCNDSCTALFSEQAYYDSIYDEIQNRKKIQRYYSQEELWYMLLVISRTAASIHKAGSKWIIGNIHTKNILLNEDGLIKIVTLNSLPYERDHFQTYIHEGLLNAYISPQLIGFAYSKTKNTKIDYPQCLSKQISQAFTLGMTILAMSLLENNLDDVYDTSFYFQFPVKTSDSHHRENSSSSYDKKTLSNYSSPIRRTVSEVHTFTTLLNQDFLRKAFVQVRRRYSAFLSSVIERLLAADYQHRMGITNLYTNILEPYEGYIEAMELGWLPKNQYLRQLTEQDEDEVMSKNSVQPFESRLF